jgi:hypothetical protein
VIVTEFADDDEGASLEPQAVAETPITDAIKRPVDLRMV